MFSCALDASARKSANIFALDLLSSGNSTPQVVGSCLVTPYPIEGDVLVHWQGTAPTSTCMKMNISASVSGGSGNEARVHLWADDKCTIPAQSLTRRGNDHLGYPCFNTRVGSFTVDK